MEISLKELKSLAIELSESDNNKDLWCRNSSKLKNQETNNSPLVSGSLTLTLIYSENLMI